MSKNLVTLFQNNFCSHCECFVIFLDPNRDTVNWEGCRWWESGSERWRVRMYGIITITMTISSLFDPTNILTLNSILTSFLFLPPLHFATSAPTPRLKLVNSLMEATNLNLDPIETRKLLDMKTYISYSLIFYCKRFQGKGNLLQSLIERSLLLFVIFKQGKFKLIYIISSVVF